MQKLHAAISEYPVYTFLLVTFFVSLLSFALMTIISGAQTPESSKGLPIWLLAIWSPNIAAIFIWLMKQEFNEKIQLAFSFPKFSWWILLALLPLLITACLLVMEIFKGNKIEWSNFQLSYLAPLILINLFMGPLGEELGWRSFLYPFVKNHFGWMAAALIVGVIWALWHAPLWWIDSPQSKIPFWSFAANVLCLSILMGVIYNHSGGSILAIIFLHLTFNISAGFIDIIDSHEAGDFFTKSLYFYIPLTLILSGIHEWVSHGECTIPPTH